MLNAVLFKSDERFSRFREKLSEYGVNCTILDFDDAQWIDFDYSNIDFLLYFPTFQYSSNHPLSASRVRDNIKLISTNYPKLRIFPEPKLTEYYNDKYTQYLFLKKHQYPIPQTYPLVSNEYLDMANQELGYPMIIKNRYGAGGGFVFKVSSKRELEKYYKLSELNFCNYDSAKYYFNMLSKRLFYYHLIKAKKMAYPFLSSPLIAQEFVRIDRDLRIVVGNYKVVEAHWRIQASERQWKMNIDDGGIGEWSKIPMEAIKLSENLAQGLKARWVAVDMIHNGRDYLITEFSPVWHHYSYNEKPTFVYKEDYNIDTPLNISLDLEGMVVKSLMGAAKQERGQGDSQKGQGMQDSNSSWEITSPRGPAI